ncbi:Rrf2 family transcriptional regulator [Limosilactobacillus caecicola]|uniref:Rrf2 family transcriptional regulator n=1 Tax=Limosilactobacillus caecicola TaxID=2941332 RepID=UPI00203FE8FA|nr:Rrf2 family transcriptional regulator [Limosilactobacillus caecicola]
MRVSTRFSDSIHTLAYIEICRGKVPLTSENIAESIETSPVVVRRLMSKLRAAKIITTVHGTADPKLTREPSKITLYDIYLAVEGDQPLFNVDKKTNPECIVGGNIQPVLTEFYHAADVAAKGRLNQFTLQDVLDSIGVRLAKNAQGI